MLYKDVLEHFASVSHMARVLGCSRQLTYRWALEEEMPERWMLAAQPYVDGEVEIPTPPRPGPIRHKYYPKNGTPKLDKVLGR